MNQQIKQLIEKLAGYWRHLEQRQRRNLLIVAGLFVLTVALLSWFAFRPNYVVVFANQTPASLGQIAQELDTLKIPYQAGTDSLSVPEQYQNEARMKVAMAGLPQTGTVGYGVFDKTSTLGMTQDEFNVRYKEALESNIQDDIQTLQGVRQAKVNIVMPQQQLFVEQQTNDAKASVVVELDPGVKLSVDQVTGIQQLVSHSVQGLLPANVSIVDQNGTRLVDDSGQAVGDAGSTQVSKQQQIENQVESDATNKIRDALERLEGLNNVSVVVHADINFDQLTWTDKKLTTPIPNSKTGAVISEQNSSEDQQGSNGATAPAGTTSATPGGPPTYPTGSNTANSDTKKSDTVNYDWNTYTDQGQSAQYKVNGYTVSVLVNDPNLTALKKTQISDFVATAIGQQNGNSANNSITVTGGPFQAPANPFTNTNVFYKQPWFMGALAAALVLLGGGVFFASRRRKQPVDLEMAAPPRREDPPMVAEETENQKMKKQLEKLASQKPEDFVNLLRTWLVEE